MFRLCRFWLRFRLIEWMNMNPTFGNERESLCKIGKVLTITSEVSLNLGFTHWLVLIPFIVSLQNSKGLLPNEGKKNPTFSKLRPN